VSNLNEARVRSWATRRARYGKSGTPSLIKRRGYTGPRAKPSDRLTDDDYRTRLKSQIKMIERGCWEWQGYRHPKGYGDMSYRSTNWRVHRLAYFLFKGPIPAGMVICHTCDNRPCCNPDHLFPGTIDTNNKDMAAKGRCKYSEDSWPRCKHGHEFTPENTYICGRGFRHCKTCDRIRMSSPEYRAKANERQRLKRAQKKAQMQQMSET